MATGKGKAKEVVEETPVVEETTEEAMDNSETDLVSIAKEMNEIMGLDPEIDTDLLDDELLNCIEIEAKQVLAEDEKSMTDATWAFLQGKGFLKHLEKPAAKKPTQKSTTSAAKPKDPNAPKRGPVPREKSVHVYSLVKGTDISERKGGMLLVLQALKTFGDKGANADQLLEIVLKDDPSYKRGDILSDVSRGIASGIVVKKG